MAAPQPALIARLPPQAAGASGQAQGGEEQDVELLSNWADALIRRAEVAAGAGDAARAEALFARALGAYQAACEAADSGSGDDVSVRLPQRAALALCLVLLLPPPCCCWRLV